MPPWPSRLLSNTAASAAASSQDASARPRASSSISKAGLSGDDYDDDSDCIITAEEYHHNPVPRLYPSPRDRAPKHGRSKSHPFPSLFGSSKKRAIPVDPWGDIDSSDESGLSIFPPFDGNLPFGAGGDGHYRSGKMDERNIKTGHCLTCASMVRWPQGATVFRCPLCAMVNDLKTTELPSPPKAGLSEKWAGKKGSPAPDEPRQAPLLTVERTQAIVQRCIQSYLDVRRGLQPRGRSPSGPGFDDSNGVREKHLRPGNGLLDPLPPLGHSPSARPHPESSGRLTMQSSGNQTSAPVSFKSSPQWPHTLVMRPRTGNGRGDRMHQSPPLRSPPMPPGPSVSKPPQSAIAPNGNALRPEIQARPRSPGVRDAPLPDSSNPEEKRENRSRYILKPVEDYIIACFESMDSLNHSFPTVSSTRTHTVAGDGICPLPQSNPGPVPQMVGREVPAPEFTRLSELDAKTLLLGDVAENGSWWTGNRGAQKRSQSGGHHRDKSSDRPRRPERFVSVKSPHIDWRKVHEWYQIVLSAGRNWKEILLANANRTPSADPANSSANQLPFSQATAQDIDRELEEARMHLERTLLKATETVLKRPGRIIKYPDDIRFLLILLMNPLIHSSVPAKRWTAAPACHPLSPNRNALGLPHPNRGYPPGQGRSHATFLGQDSVGPGRHSGIIKRILGILSNVSNECHHFLANWLARFSEPQFRKIVDLVGGFVSYRLSRQTGRPRSTSLDPTAGLIPSISGSGASSSAQLHAALGVAGTSRATDASSKQTVYSDDWQIKAAAKIMALLFLANSAAFVPRKRPVTSNPSDAVPASAGLAARQRAQNHGQLLPTSDFYNSVLDYADLVADFETWEARRKFTFCQYPFFLSIWAKIRIMEYDARRQMEVKAREAFFDSIMSRKAVNQYLLLKVRRDCLVEDSLRGVSEVVGASQEEIKKGLRIEFRNEEGVDAGGLRKEWFLLLVREVFDPNHGLFMYDEDSHYCYFNPNCFETSDQFFLVGVVLGLAIYNSTILDVALPPFAFKKLLASAPSTSTPAMSVPRVKMTYSLEDLAEYRPALASGLRQLLEFEGDVQATFCRDFVAEIDRYGQIVQVPLCDGGESRPVTNENRQEFVQLYVQYLLDVAVARQFEPFKRGFFTVCGGNALSLFRPEEIELLVRGSDEPLDVASLRAVAIYENWGEGSTPAISDPVLVWFWDLFSHANPKDQRKLLSFVTGSDRIPAMGATNLVIKLVCLGDDCDRFPIARTCFNSLCLFRYATREKLESKLWRAVMESEGFGLK
ncbi:HECT-domain-containing protein [Xylona heveae TC161]|uniref:HECT-type E3 ubiquitin transferase n=1 Tax=Xylona heveae (strain CBS 132557 / TC161) TaxID=1328760 RepID=A0A165A5I4_XYLHT|nr:HECT-domain-containing protein [Xylona heveae TC161]KZF19980.1 HECT-domain-containing protein [Xylona heveae TC161]